MQTKVSGDQPTTNSNRQLATQLEEKAVSSSLAWCFVPSSARTCRALTALNKDPSSRGRINDCGAMLNTLAKRRRISSILSASRSLEPKAQVPGKWFTFCQGCSFLYIYNHQMQPCTQHHVCCPNKRSKIGYVETNLVGNVVLTPTARRRSA